MTPQEAQSIATAALKCGVLKLVPPNTAKDDAYQQKLERNLNRYHANKKRFLADGLTAHGTHRHYLRENLDGWTPEQKRERRLQQRRDWNRAHRKGKK